MIFTMQLPFQRRHLMQSILLLLIVHCMVSGCRTSQVSTETPEPDPVVIVREAMPEVDVQQLVPSPAPAIHTSLWWNEEIAQRDLDMVQQMGFRWIKQLFPWRDIETHEKGQYDWWRTDRIVEDAEERGLLLMVRLDHQPFWSQANGGWPPLENAPPLITQISVIFAVQLPTVTRDESKPIRCGTNLIYPANGVKKHPIRQNIQNCWQSVTRRSRLLIQKQS